MADASPRSTTLELNEAFVSDGTDMVGGYSIPLQPGSTPEVTYEYRIEADDKPAISTVPTASSERRLSTSTVVGGALRGMRVRTGCNTCRKRHVKCDEQKPICANCTKGSRTCVFPTTDSLFRHNRTTSISKKTSTATNNQAGSRKSIDFSAGLPAATVRRPSIADSPPSSLSSLNKSDVDLSGILSLATAAAGHELLPTSPTDIQSQRQMAPPLLSTNPGSARYGQLQNQSQRPAEHQFGMVMASGTDENLGQFNLPGLYYPGQSPSMFKTSQPWPMHPSETLLNPNNIPSPVAQRSPTSRTISVNDLVSGSPIMNAELVRRSSTSSRSDFGSQNFGSYDASRAGPPGLPDISEQESTAVNGYVAALSLHDHSHHQVTQIPPATLPLNDHEASIFQNFVHVIAPWIDIFDYERHFALSVPRLARSNTALLKACLALSAKQLYSLQHNDDKSYHGPNPQIEFGQYYDAALREMQLSLSNDMDGSLENSDELLVTAVILSTFEVIDASNTEFRQHLEGVKSIIRPEHGLCGGVKQAAFWCWYRQDIWDAFRERRLTHITEDYWQVDNLYMLRDDELANRIVYLLAQTINYCAKGETERNDMQMAGRFSEAEILEQRLDEWKGALPMSFQPLTETREEGTLFKKLWFNPGYCGIAIQVYHFAQIILAMHRPTLHRQQQDLAKRQLYRASSECIIGISLTRCEATRHLVSVQCLYAAGLVVEGRKERNVLVELIKECQNLTGRSTDYLARELEDIWGARRDYNDDKRQYTI